jgi:hypothetical protein
MLSSSLSLFLSLFVSSFSLLSLSLGGGNQPEFFWFTFEKIKKAQQELYSLCESTNSLNPSDELYKTIDGKIWVPDRNALRQRMCTIAHFEIANHRRVEVTRTAILSKFHWPELQHDVIDFCKKCFHCIGSQDA